MRPAQRPISNDPNLGSASTRSAAIPAREDENDRRARAIALLEANHSFPTQFSLSVIARNEDAVTSAVVTAASVGLPSPLAGDAHERRASAQGKYVSHRLTVWCASADDVLALFARLQAVEGVITVL